MKNPAHVLDMIFPRWRQLLPRDFPRDYFDAFIIRQRVMLEALVAAWLERREARRAQGPESATKSKRTTRNLEAMRIVATRRPQDMDADERRAVLGYSGWGGLSIENVTDQFPPGLVPDDFALIHEYYTPLIVAEAVAALVCPRLADLAGFDGIVRAFEPSVGIGRLVRALGPPNCMVTDPRYKEIRWTAVELSTVSARMFGAMRPDVELYATSLEQWMAEHSARYQGALNLILANPPYGQRGEYAGRDRHPDYQETKSYAYFIRRCLDLLVPGGLGVFLIPQSFLSGTTNRTLRERILRRHHLEVAFRLPSESSAGKDLFPGAGGVVDVLVWRARGGELGAVDEADEFILGGRYFEENPTHILGAEHTTGEDDKSDGKKKRRRYTVVGDFTGFPAFTPRPVCASCSLQSIRVREVAPADSIVRDMGDEPGDLEDELRHAMDLGRRVDRYLALVAAEDERALSLFAELHVALESLKKTPALAAHDGNPWRWMVLRKLAERRAVAQRLLAAYQKTGELSPSVATPPGIQPKFRAQPDDVLAQAEHLFRRSRRLTVGELAAFHREQGGRQSRDAMVATLLAAGWCLDGDDWDNLEPEPTYVTGKLWPKHDAVTARAATDRQAARQLQRLQAAMDLAVFEDIRDVSPRQGWITLDLVSAWMTETLNDRYGAVQLIREGGVVHPEGREYEALDARGALTPESLWCIGWMNHDNTLFKPKLEDEEIAKLQAEEAAQTGHAQTKDPDQEHTADGDDADDVKIGQIRLLLGHHWNRAFADWVAAREERRAAVTTAYNRSFRGTVIPSFEGDSLGIVRWNENGPQLKPHQVAGALRILHFGFGLLAFDVGVGKTFTAIAVIARARQDGCVRRPVVLVPGSLVWQWYDNFTCVLPDYRIAVIGSNRKRISRGVRKDVITSETDTPEQRAEKWTALQAGLVDVVILSYDALSRTKLNEETLLEYVAKVDGIQRQIKLRQRNAAEKSQDKLSEREKAILKHGARAWVEEMLEIPEDRKFDPGIAWDDIGIDMLVVDEATAFKNSYKPEPREHGMPKFMGNAGDGSKRAWQLDFRAAAVRRHTGGSGIVLLTATPAKNSPLEFYNLIQLMDPHAFSQKGLMDPEQFIDRFLRIESREIIDITLKVATRSVVDGFVNLDDLRTIIRTYGEFRSGAEVGLKLPEPRSEQVHVSMNDAQEAEYGRLVRKIETTLQRMKATGGGGQGTILGLLARLSMIALHPRLGQGIEYTDALKAVHPDEYAAPKLLACAERIAASPGCGHIVFCEPTAVHKWMVETLVARGIPRERIAVLNAVETKPADRTRIARQFNGISADPPAPGSCATSTARRVPPMFDVLIANSVANEGLDAQTRTCAIHHLDLPWTSSDLEQRNGRAVRQGNENATVRIYYYMSERSMDWYRYQLIQGKRAWLSAVLESQARDTSNPGAQQSLSDEEILLMISRNPEATKRAIEGRREVLRAESRAKVAREASSLLVQASARFRDARDTTDGEKASRLRAEGEDRLRDLRRVDVDAWPWAKWTTQVREVEYMVPSTESAPVYEGLRVQKADGTFIEFGRIVETELGRRIGKRDLGSPTWELLEAEEVRTLALEPAALEAGVQWPDEIEADYATALGLHIERTLKPGSSFADLQWRGASDAWLTRWWPRIERNIRDGLVRVGRNGDEDETYPIVADGKLSLAQEKAPRRGELLAPTLAGWRRFLELAPASGLKYAALRLAAETWWDRRLPRGLVAGSSSELEPVDEPLPEPSPPPEPEPEPEPQVPPPAQTAKLPPPTHTDQILHGFNVGPEFRLRLEHRGAQNRFIFVVTREGSEDDVVASIDVSGSEITDVRWLASNVRPVQERDILARLERALADAALAEAATDEMVMPDAASSLRPLIETLERLGRENHGMDLRRALDTSRTDPLRALAFALKDLSEPTTTTPEALAARLDESELWTAAEVLRDPDVLAFSSVDEVLDRLWAALDKQVPLTKVKRRSGGLAVEATALGGDIPTRTVVARESGKGSRYRLRRIEVKVLGCQDERCAVEAPDGTLRAGAEVYLQHERGEPFLRNLVDSVADLERTLRDAPRLLADVRQLLVLAGALIDTHRCQGREQAAALRAFDQAKRHHDAARRLLVAGKTAVAAERIHAAMRRIAAAAAQITQDCAAGQQTITPAQLPVTPDDAATLEEN